MFIIAVEYIQYIRVVTSRIDEILLMICIAVIRAAAWYKYCQHMYADLVARSVEIHFILILLPSRRELMTNTSIHDAEVCHC